MRGIKQKYQVFSFQTEQTEKRKKSGFRAAPQSPRISNAQPFVLKLEIKNGKVYQIATNSTRATNSYTYLILKTLIMLL